MSHNQTINETPIPFRYAVIPMLVMIIIMGICVIVLKASPHVPLLIGTATAAFIASRFGYTWNFIEEACYAGIKMALPAILIIIMIGLTIGSWIGGGIVATMVYYGLELLSPSMFLFTICSICCIVTLAIGSSWATMGTIGVAAMGIGHSIDIPAPMWRAPSSRAPTSVTRCRRSPTPPTWLPASPAPTCSTTSGTCSTRRCRASSSHWWPTT